MKRTKEALIAQHQSRQKETVLETTRPFSFTQFPPAKDLQKSFIFFAIALAFIAVPFILPDLGRDFLHRRAVGSVSQFELNNDVHRGQFKRTPHAGDTRPNDAATFYALSILSENTGGPAIKTEDFTDAVKQLEAKDFDKNAEKIYRGVVQLKALGLLTGSVAEQYAEKYYNLLLSLAERRSAFRLDSSRSASVSATFYALQAIKELGKLEQFKKRDEFKGAVSFVVSAKDTVSGGFRDTLGENATLTATWHAVQILAEAEQTEEVKKAFENVAQFVFSTQAKDGGFLNTPVTTNEEMYNSRSRLATTAQGLFILETLKQLGYYSPSLTDVKYINALSYLRACLSATHGVLGQYPSNESDLEATYYFLTLVKAFPNLAYGMPRYVQLGLVGVGFIFALLSALAFYSGQIPDSAVDEIKADAWATLGYLVAAAVALHFYPTLAIFAYLALAFHLAIQTYNALAQDTTEGFMTLTATANTFAYMGFVCALIWASPFAFANVEIFYGLLAWGAVVTLLVTFGAVYLTGIKKLHFFVCAGYLSWVLNTVLLYAFLYGKGEFQTVFRLLVVHGHFPIVFVVLPFASLILSYAVSAAATALYFGGVVTVSVDSAEKKNKKRKTESDAKGSSKAE
jgi:prenyltransferase beta subunit